MELKVRALDIIEPKSVQEVEQQLLEKHEESLSQDNNPEPAATDPEPEPQPKAVELKDEDVLSYIISRLTHWMI
jgi:hypothetical protein